MRRHEFTAIERAVIFATYRLQPFYARLRDASGMGDDELCSKLLDLHWDGLIQVEKASDASGLKGESTLRLSLTAAGEARLMSGKAGR